MTLPTRHAPSKVADEESVVLTESDALQTLATGKMAEHGLLPYSSNHSFLVAVSRGRLTLPAVYKPQRGETPLWDFEWGSLCKRETAAYEVSHSLGWDLVPPTVLRRGTRGLGSVQLYVPHEDDQHYFTVQADARFAVPLRRLALFDYTINNADRKSGHCLIGSAGASWARLWAIDHGVCFHSEFKMRTVVWEFSGTPIEPALLQDLERFRADLCNEDSATAHALCRLLTGEERSAMLERVETLIHIKRYPSPHPHRRNYPWPPI